MGTMGQDAPQTLPPDQEAAWIGILGQCKASLDRSAAALRARSAGLAKVRADLGLPANDPMPTGENAPQVSALTYYVSSHAWTLEAQAA